MKVLVTGGSGFIGRNLAYACSSRGWQVETLDNEEFGKHLPTYKGRIEDYDLLLKATKDKDIVFHEAAVTSPPEFDSDNISSFNVNVMGTLNVLKASSVNNVCRVVLASSSSVYGDSNLPGNENSALPHYYNLYPLSKSVKEELAVYFALRGETETISLRYFNTYGASENSKGAHSSVISKFVGDLSYNRRPVIFGDGTQRRDFVYIEDVVKANLLAIQNGESGGVYNVGTGVSHTFNEIFEIVKSEMGSDLQPIYKAVPYKSYQLFTQANIDKSERELGFKAVNSVEDGVKKMLATTQLIDPL